MKHVSLFFRPRLVQPTGSVLLLAGLLATAPAAWAQTAQEPFGRVRIQYKDFDWLQFSTQNFTVYYYAGGEANARHAAEYAEKELQRITGLIGYYPYSKTTIMLFNSVGDLRQSNVGLAAEKFTSGGETSLSRSTKVQIAFQGTQTGFKQELSGRITEVLLNDMMYGGSLKEVIQSSYLLQLPNWFIDGASAYAAQGWSVEMDDYMRTMLQEHEGNRPAPFFLRNPELAGQSVWNYIAERYGYTSIQNILNLTRITRDVEVGISSSLNVPYKVFLKDWLAYYRQLNAQPLTPFQDLDENRSLAGRNRRNILYSQPVLSPNGQRLAYVQNDRGRYRVLVVNQNGKGRDVIHRGGYKTPDQQVETRLPLLAWLGNGQVAVVEEQRGQLMLQLREANGGLGNLTARLKGLLPRFGRRTSLFSSFSQITALNYSPDGKSAVFSGVKQGQGDLYLLRAGTRAPEKLTNDVFDDVEPVFMPDGQSLVFSSNRWLDSAGTARGAFGAVVNNYDLYRYHLDGRPQPVEALVSTISNEVRPRAISNDEILFISEESGVRSLYRYSLSTRDYQPVTSFRAGIQDFDYNAATNTLGLIANADGRSNAYLYPNYALPASLRLAKTARQEILEDRSRPAKAVAPNRPGPTVAAAQAQGTATGTAPATTAPAAGIATTPATGTEASPAKAPTKTTRVNPNNYEFDEDIPASRAPSPTAPRRRAATAVALPKAAAAPEATTLAGPFRYGNPFSLDNVVSTLTADPLLGLGFSAQANMSDLLEDHRIRAGIFALTDLRTSNIFAEYTNLKHRYDWSIRYQKQAYFPDLDPVNRIRYGRHEIAPTLAYPLTHNLSVRLGPRFVSVSRRLYSDLANANDVNTNYLGGEAELVFDNSVVTGINMLQGTRMKAGINRLRDLSGNNTSFTKLTVDLRHYQKIHRQLIWANRASFGQYVGGGSARPFFRLGGMDNWLNADYADARYISGNGAAVNSAELLDPTQMFYQQFVTNLRGFDYSKRVGSKYLLFNSELRLPIIQYFARRPIESGFFRNLQLTAFADAGTTYSGSNPFSVNNSNNTVVVAPPGNGFSATVVNFTNPLLYGYGTGIRTTMLGFYVKGDVAWGREQYRTSSPRIYATLGYDF